jgi:hypothetical protein
MMRRMLTALAAAFALAAVLAGAAAAALPARLDLPPVADALPQPHSFPLPDRALLADQDKAAAEAGEPWRFAVPFAVSLTPKDAGAWTTAADGRDAWRLRVTSPGALSLNLAFLTCALPPSGELVLRPVAGGRSLRFAGPDLAGAELWTPVLLTDDLLVDVLVAADERSGVRLELAQVNAGYRWFGDQEADKAGACNVDVVCPEGDPWRQEIRSVAVYQVGGTWKCTGAMINNTALDQAPLFLTAAHCNVTAVNQASVVVYWNFESPSCGQHGGGSLDDVQTGSTLLANWFHTSDNGSSDLCLLELNNDPDPAWNVTWAGWSRADQAPTSSVAIHHPSTDEKSISFDNDAATITAYLQTAVPGDGTHLRIGAWELGTTEPGSSGSPLFDQDHRIVGQLHGGYASCVQPLASDWYGRLFTSWSGAGTPATRLSDWLDPTGTGVVALDILVPGAGVLQVAAQDDLEWFGPVRGPFQPGAAQVVLSNQGEAALAWQAATTANWLTITPADGALDPGQTQAVSVAVGEPAASRPPGVAQATVNFVNTTNGVGGAALDAVLRVYEGRMLLGAVGPNPFRGYCTVRGTLLADATVSARVYDVRGRMAADLGTSQEPAGSWALTWDGSDHGGRRQPGGRYVLRLDVEGQVFAVPLTLLH